MLAPGANCKVIHAKKWITLFEIASQRSASQAYWVTLALISNIANYLKYNYIWDCDGIDNIMLRLWKFSDFKTHCRRRGWWYHVPHSSFLLPSFIAISMTQYICASFWRLRIITHCELSYQDFVRMSSLIVHCERNSPVTTGFPTLKARNTDHWLFIPQPSGLEGYCRHGPGGRLPDLWNPYLCNRLTDVLFLKFCGIVEACSCALSWSFAHLPHMGLLMGQKLVKFATNWVQTLRIVYLWNRWMDLPHLKFYGHVKTCSCVQRHSYLPICPIYGLDHRPKTCQIRQHFGQTLRNPYPWNRWMDLYHSKFYGIV